MADTKTGLPAFDLGISDSEVYGSIQAAEDFLSGGLDGDSDELERADAPPKKVTPPKKKEEPKPEEEEEEDQEDPLKLFLGDEEDEDEEDSDEEEKPKNKTLKDAVQEEDEDEDNNFVTISKELHKAGFFTLDEDEEPTNATTAEELMEKFNTDAQKRSVQWLEGYLGRYGEDRKELFDAIFVNGVDPKEYLPKYNEVQDLSNIDLTQESAQELIIRTAYKDQGLSEEVINRKIERLKSYADLEQEALDLHPTIVDKKKRELIEIEEQKTAELERIAAQDAEYQGALAKTLQDKVKNKNFDGIPLNPKDAEEVFKMLYEKRWKTPKGEFLTEFDRLILDSKKPDNIADRIKIALLLKNKFDFSKIEKKAISKESNELFSGIAQKKAKKSNKAATTSRWNV